MMPMTCYTGMADTAGSTDAALTIRTLSGSRLYLCSSAIASNLAKGYDLDTAVEQAKAYISGALAAMLDLGAGSGPMNHAFEFCGKGFAKEEA